MSRVSLTMALYAFIVFIGRAIGKKIHHSMSYPLFILFTLSMMFLIYHYTHDDVILTLVLSQVMLMTLYCIIFGVYRYHDALEDHPIEESFTTLKRILSGKRLISKKPNMFVQADIIRDLHGFLQKLDGTTKFIISFFNIVLISGQIYLFLMNLGQGDTIVNEILLWFGIIAFFVNYLLLRQIDFYHTMQRIVAFVLINFGIYLTVVNIFGADPVYIVGVGAVWSFLNSFVMFHT